MTLRNSHLYAEKMLFWDHYEAPFLACKLLATHLLHTLCIWKMFIRVGANVWYNLEHHTTFTSRYMDGESDFCRFLPSVVSLTRSGTKCMRKYFAHWSTSWRWKKIWSFKSKIRHGTFVRNVLESGKNIYIIVISLELTKRPLKN